MILIQKRSTLAEQLEEFRELVRADREQTAEIQKAIRRQRRSRSYFKQWLLAHGVNTCGIGVPWRVFFYYKRKQLTRRSTNIPEDTDSTD